MVKVKVSPDWTRLLRATVLPVASAISMSWAAGPLLTRKKMTLPELTVRSLGLKLKSISATGVDRAGAPLLLVPPPPPQAPIADSARAKRRNLIVLAMGRIFRPIPG